MALIKIYRNDKYIYEEKLNKFEPLQAFQNKIENVAEVIDADPSQNFGEPVRDLLIAGLNIFQNEILKALDEPNFNIIWLGTLIDAMGVRLYEETYQEHLKKTFQIEAMRLLYCHSQAFHNHNGKYPTAKLSDSNRNIYDRLGKDSKEIQNSEHIVFFKTLDDSYADYEFYINTAEPAIYPMAKKINNFYEGIMEIYKKSNLFQYSVLNTLPDYFISEKLKQEPQPVIFKEPERKSAITDTQRDAYQNIATEKNGSLNIRKLFYDYMSWPSFFLHPGRHHRAAVKAVLQDKNLNDEEILEKLQDLRDKLKKKGEFNSEGSLARRITFIEEQMEKNTGQEPKAGLD